MTSCTQEVPVGHGRAGKHVQEETDGRRGSRHGRRHARSAPHRQLTGKARDAVDNRARHLLNNKQYLRYQELLRDSLPVPPGVIEGACRSLVKDRMDITGPGWGLAGAESVLKLRSLRASGDLDQYLHFQR